MIFTLDLSIFKGKVMEIMIMTKYGAVIGDDSRDDIIKNHLPRHEEFIKKEWKKFDRFTEIYLERKAFVFDAIKTEGKIKNIEDRGVGSPVITQLFDYNDFLTKDYCENYKL